MNSFRPHHDRRSSRQGGFSLIELMVALLIGLLVVAAAGTIFISNRQTYAATETMGRMQENGRIAFELMARELREAGASPCGANVPIANVLRNPGAAGDLTASGGLRGFPGNQEVGGVGEVEFGAGVGDRVAGTQAISFRSMGNSGVTVTRHNPASAVIHTGGVPHDFQAGDILMICDFSQASVFEANNVGGALQIVHHRGNSSYPGGGNFCKSLSFPVDVNCEERPRDGKQYADNATIARLSNTVWYIGNNSRGGRSLFRKQTSRDAEEVTEGVNDMRFQYLVSGTSSYRDAGAVTPASQWGEVAAVQVELDLRAAEGALRNREIAGTDGAALERRLTHTVTIRGRNP